MKNAPAASERIAIDDSSGAAAVLTATSPRETPWHQVAPAPAKSAWSPSRGSC